MMLMFFIVDDVIANASMPNMPLEEPDLGSMPSKAT